jgi:hypothetical protein
MNMHHGGRLRANLKWFRARYDDGARSPGVFAAIKELETAIAWGQHRDETRRLPSRATNRCKNATEALRFIAKVTELFPGSERDIIIIRQKPTSPSPRGTK